MNPAGGPFCLPASIILPCGDYPENLSKFRRESPLLHMYTGNYYKFKEFFLWTRKNIYKLIPIAIIPTAIYSVLDWKWIAVPWVPVALLGTASAFIVGFRNTQVYNRMWEARQIWGSIVNSSRTWGLMVKDYIRDANPAVARELHRQLIYRHVAWLTAMRFQMREPRSWETIKTKSYNLEYTQHYKVPEWESSLADELPALLSKEETTYVLGKKNRATQLIALQGDQLKQLQQNGHLSELCYVELENVLKELYDHQGRSERIKNFPYPRQFSSIACYFITLLVWLLPFGMLNEFARLGNWGVWLNIPFSVIVGWVFMALDQVGESTENPFEGSANDIPITTMSRTIEIDLREMLDETDLPPAIAPLHNIQM